MAFQSATFHILLQVMLMLIASNRREVGVIPMSIKLGHIVTTDVRDFAYHGKK